MRKQRSLLKEIFRVRAESGDVRIFSISITTLLDIKMRSSDSGHGMEIQHRAVGSTHSVSCSAIK